MRVSLRFRPAYNVQFATDTKSSAIAGVSVDNIGSDMGKMLPMNEDENRWRETRERTLMGSPTP
jgi:hypothetical protein